LVSNFQLKNIFDENYCKLLIINYNFSTNDYEKFSSELSITFRDFIILILSENSSYSIEERNKLYNEAIYNLQHTSKLLQGMPHPASSMSYKLIKMSETLKKVIIGGKREKSNANRFIEKNLVRKFIAFWDEYNQNKFLTLNKEINYKVCDCFIDCSKKISIIYPELEWFKNCEIEFIKSLFENI